MLRVRFYEVVDRDHLSEDGGTIAVGPDGLVRVSDSLAFALDLPAREDIRDSQSPSTRPAGGFEQVSRSGGQTVFRPVGGWDPEMWLDRVRHHFRTPYLRPGEVEIDDNEPAAEDAPGAKASEGLFEPIPTAYDISLPDGPDPLDDWFATGEGWDDLTPTQQAHLREWIGDDFTAGDPLEKEGS